MADELEYVISGALLDCSEGTVPGKFQATPRNVRIQGLRVGNAADKLPFTNIPSFAICQQLTKAAGGTPVPCVPAVTAWQDTYPVRVNKQEVLLFRSHCRCTTGQGKIEFITSGQSPVPPEMSQQLEAMQQEAQAALAQAEAEKDSVGEAGFLEGMIPIWGSGRDLIHSVQTGSWGMAALNAGFLVWDIASVAAGLVTFGAATVAMQGAKTGVRSLIKAGTKVAVRGVVRQTAEALAKAAAMKVGLRKGLLKLASTRVCVLACFEAGTPVAVGGGGYRNIEELVAGDMVWGRHEQTGVLGLYPVVATMSRTTDHLIELRLGSERIATTTEHPFYSRVQSAEAGTWVEGWQRAGTLVVGDAVLRSDGQWVGVRGVAHRTEFAEPVAVYNIEVADAHTYFVGKWQWWVHNATVCISKGLKELKELAKKFGKPPHSPDFKKWLDKGGDIKVSDNGKEWVYKRKDGVEVTYKDGHPTFDPHARQEVKIPEMKGNHTTDYTDADRLAPKGPRQDGNTWHHHQDMKRMQEVPTDIHKDFTHKGGVSGTKKSKGVKLKKK
jgi:hypothetical protein